MHMTCYQCQRVTYLDAKQVDRVLQRRRAMVHCTHCMRANMVSQPKGGTAKAKGRSSDG